MAFNFDEEKKEKVLTKEEEYLSVIERRIHDLSKPCEDKLRSKHDAEIKRLEAARDDILKNMEAA